MINFKQKKKAGAVLLCLLAIGLTACAGGQEDAADVPMPGEPVVVAGEKERGERSEEQRETDVTTGTEQREKSEDEKLEENLAAFREERENTKPIDLGNGVTMGGTVNEAEFGISFDASALSNFDTRELMAAIDTADDYVENTLGISIETRQTTYLCMDPRIWEIYNAEDKGVADGYAPENIYICEYCDSGTWQYLILVREGKGSAWEVIHHGSSYLE